MAPYLFHRGALNSSTVLLHGPHWRFLFFTVLVSFCPVFKVHLSDWESINILNVDDIVNFNNHPATSTQLLSATPPPPSHQHAAAGSRYHLHLHHVTQGHRSPLARASQPSISSTAKFFAARGKYPPNHAQHPRISDVVINTLQNQYVLTVH